MRAGPRDLAFGVALALACAALVWVFFFAH
jgi:hypothetical protein